MDTDGVFMPVFLLVKFAQFQDPVIGIFRIFGKKLCIELLVVTAVS